MFREEKKDPITNKISPAQEADSTAKDNNRRRILGWSLFFFATNFVLKLLYLDANSLAGDEPFSVYHAQMPVSDIINRLSLGNNPPLWEILLHYWALVFGISEMAVRFMPLLFVSLTASLVLLAGERYFKRYVGVLAAVLFTLANLQFVFAHEARVYPLFELLTVLSFILCWEMTKKHNRNLAILLGLGLTDALLLYSHYFSIWVLGIQFIILFMHAYRQDRREIRLFYPFIFAFICYIPNFQVLLTRFMESSGKGTWVQKPGGISTLYTFIWNLTNAPVGAVMALIIIGIGILFLARQRKMHDFFLLALTSLVPMLCMFAASFKVPMFVDRYLLYTAPGFYLLLAYVLLEFPAWLRYTATPVLCGIMLFSLNLNPGNQEKVRELAHFVKAHKTAHTAVFILPEWFDLTFAYYYDPALFRRYNTESIYQTVRGEWNRQGLYSIRDSAQVKAVMNQNQFNTLMLIDHLGDFHFPGNGVKAYLDRHYTQTQILPFGSRISLLMYQ